jgi:curved DNA-binding protein CbpA
MGGVTSVAAFDPAHVRIYTNIIKIQEPRTRSNMIQTCLSAPEYVISAKRAGIYSYLLSYVSAVNNGYKPSPLPGEFGLAATAPQQQQQPVPRAMAWSTLHQSQADAIASGAGRPAPPQVRSDQLAIYQEKAPTGPSWQQIVQTPKQKMVSYFASCLEVLNIQEEVALTEETLKKAYKKSALAAHPDKGGSEEHFEAVTRAYAYLSEILKRMKGGRETTGKVEAPSVLDGSRKEEAKQWKHVEPVKLNAKNLDMNAFNKMFEETHMPDPDQDGYGDWLKTEGGSASAAPKFSGKFNRDVFNNMFEQEARKGAAHGQGQLQIIHPEAMALGPTMGIEIGRDRPQDYTAAPNSKSQFTDLRAAYTTESTISDKIAGVKVEERRLDTYKASREKAPDPYNDAEMRQLQQSEMMLKQREEMRQRRAAERGVVENEYFERMKRLVITEK